MRTTSLWIKIKSLFNSKPIAYTSLLTDNVMTTNYKVGDIISRHGETIRYMGEFTTDFFRRVHMYEEIEVLHHYGYLDDFNVKNNLPERTFPVTYKLKGIICK